MRAPLLQLGLPLVLLSGVVAVAAPVDDEGPPDPGVPEPSLVAPRPAGQYFPSAPRLVPGTPPTPHALDDLVVALRRGDAEGALHAAEHLGRRLNGRERAAAWMAAGMLHRAEGRANLASEAFTRVRMSHGPLAPLAAWYEAEQDLRRGRPGVAARECEALLTSDPDHLHAEDCEQLIAFALAEQGRVHDALEAAAAWDEAHDEAPITEQVRLQLGAWQLEHDPDAAVRTFRHLATTFRAPITERVARQALAVLADAGVADAEVPEDRSSRMARAHSFKESRRCDEAWALHTALRETSDDPVLTRWGAETLTDFAWACRRWDALEQVYRGRLDADPDAHSAWYLYRSLDRGGRYEAAAEAIRDGLDRFGDERIWRGEEERLGRTFLLAGAYDDARDQFDRLAGRRGWTGLRNRYYAAFAAFMAGDDADARERFDAVIADGEGLVTEARYWRARLVVASDPAQAAADQAWIRTKDPGSWYALLLDGPPDDARDGRWRGTPPPPAPDAPHPVVTRAPEVVGPVARGTAYGGGPAWSVAGWPLATATPLPPSAPLEPLPTLRGDYRPSAFFQPADAEARFDAVVEDWGDTWPVLLTVQDLAQAGLYDLSGPLFGRFYDRWLDEVKRRDPDARALGDQLDKDDWRALFLHVHDHHQATRFTWGLSKHAPEGQAADVEALSLPLAHRDAVWRASREHDVDPLLVLALMRTESLYDALAVSRVGARGPMQIMPRTGHLLADLGGDVGFHPGELHDPQLAIAYGIRYLGLLLDRFDGVYPLAVASYNGGPHNMSHWLAAVGADTPLDVLVEHIPYGETRRYVRSVTERYAAYTRLYAPEGQGVLIPPHAQGDHPEIVDF